MEINSSQGNTGDSPQRSDLINLWEQMGASTGSYLGKVIGLYAQYGLVAFEQLITTPLQQLSENAAQQLDNSDQPPDIREQTWGKMCGDYGQTVGSTIGMSMDLLVNSLKNITPTGMPGDCPNCDTKDETTQ